MNDVIEQVKSKYPQYRDVPDDELTLKIADKYPQYLSNPSFSNDVVRLKTPAAKPAAASAAPASAADTAQVDERGQAVQPAGQFFFKDAPDEVGLAGEPAPPPAGRGHQPTLLGQLTAPLVPLPRIPSAMPAPAGSSAIDKAELAINALPVDAANTAIGTLEGFESPLGLVTLGGIGLLPKLAQRLVSAGFTADMIRSAVKQAPGLWDAIKKGDWQDAQKRFLEFGATGAMATAAGLHAASGGPPKPPPTPLEAKAAEIAPVAPLTAEALIEKPAATAAQPKEQNASEVAKTAEIHGDVRPQPEPAIELPKPVSGEGVQPQAEGGLQKEEPAQPHSGAPESVAPAPEAKPAEADLGWAVLKDGEPHGVFKNEAQARMVASAMDGNVEVKPMNSKVIFEEANKDQTKQEFAAGVTPKTVPKPPTVTAQAAEFRKLVQEHAHEHDWLDVDKLNPNVLGEQKHDTGSIQAKMAHQKAVAQGYRRAMTDLGLKGEQTKPSDLAAALPKLKAFLEAHTKLVESPIQDMPEGSTFTRAGREYTVGPINPDTLEVTINGPQRMKVHAEGSVMVDPGSVKAAPINTEFVPPEKPAPKLAPGVKQGDLIASTQREDFALSGEKGTDLERVQAAKEKAAKDAAEAKALADKQQLDLLAQKPAPEKPAEPAAKTEGGKAAAYRVKGAGPQLFEVVRELPASDVEKANNEQPVEVRNRKTGVTQTVLKSDLEAVTEHAPKTKPPKRDLDAELRAAKLDPSVFPDNASKLAALKRAKIKSMGGMNPADPEETQPAQIEQLESAFRGIEGKKVTFSQKVKDAFNLGGAKSEAKDAIGRGLDALKSSGDFIKRRFLQIDSVDDMLRAKGELSSELEKRGWRLRQFERTVKQAMPSVRERAAVSKYVDAGGDAAVLRRGLAEAPKEYKQAYQDALNFNPEQKLAAENIRNYFDARLEEAIEAGVLEDGVTDYIHRIYEKDPAKLKKAMAYVQSGILSKNPALAKKRVFEFDFEAEKAGLKPVQDFLPRLLTYESSLSRAIAAREFIKKATTLKAADGRPVVDVKALGIPIEDPSGVRQGTLIKPQSNPAKNNLPGTPQYRGDYVNREYPALSKWKWVGEDAGGKPIYVQGDVAIHPDYAGRVDALLEPSRLRYGKVAPVTRPLLALGSTVKSTMLDFSGFHQVQLAVHALEHRVNPLNLTKEIDFNNPDVDGLLKGGVTLGGDYHMASEGVFGKSLSRLIPGIGPVMDSYHHWLFQDFIPRLKMTMAQHALERNRERFKGVKTDEEIYRMTANQANAAFGEQNYIMLERSKTAQDLSRLILLAPDFLESRGRFVGQALQKGGKGGPLSNNEQRMALFLGAMTMWAAARLTNKAVSGQWHEEPENLFSVVYNGKSYGLRTVQGDVLHLLENPMSFWLHRLNPVITRPALEAMTGRDEFGRKRDWQQQIWDDVSTTIPIALRSSRERSLMESIDNSFGITARRFSAADRVFELAAKWKKANGIESPGEFIYDRDKDPLRPLKLALVDNDEGGAAKEIKKLMDSKKYNPEKLGRYFARYAEMPFTGSRANDFKFAKSLNEDDKKSLVAARESKREIRKLYFKAFAKYRDAMKDQSDDLLRQK